jgi:hypothetical protein
MKIILSPVKGWWKKRLSLKSPVDEKRSGRPSILRKVQKMVISKSLHKREWSTRKLASKLTIKGPNASKTLSIDIWGPILEPIHAKGLFYAKFPKIRWQMTSAFHGGTEVNSLKTWWGLYLQDECPAYLSVPGTRKNDRIWPKNRSKVKPMQKSKFAPKIIVWVAVTASVVSELHAWPPNRTVRAKYNQESILSPFLPDDMNMTGDTGKVTERRFHEIMLDLTLLQNGAQAHKDTETQGWLWQNFSQF